MQTAKQRPLVWRIILYFSLASLVMTVLMTAAILTLSYYQQMQAQQQRLELLKNSYSDSLGTSLWFYDESQLRIQITGITNIDNIQYVRVTDNLNLNFEQGSRPHASQVHSFPLSFNDQKVGLLQIAFDADSILKSSLQAAINSLSAQLLSMLILVLLLGYIVHKLINQRLITIAASVDQHRQRDSYSPLMLKHTGNHDEIDTLIEAFNALSEKTNQELQQKIQAQQQLKQANLALEDRVQERTQDLQKTVDELNQTLEQLHSTQTKLVEAEKLSALGGMVAGIAHEINTPLGLAITLQSYINDNFKALNERFLSGDMRKQELTDFISSTAESLQILDRNLQRAAQLIKSFKQVSEDQIGEHIRKFTVHSYILEILETLSPKLKKTKHRVQINCPDQLWMQTYAGALSQVLTNLIMNSLIHAFEDIEEGLITLDVREEKGNIVIRYHDNGLGLTEEAKLKIFEPFYTTKRGYGGTGLGMSLVYNIVNQRLHGDIEIDKDNAQGTAYWLTLPKITPESNAEIS